jgi:hypothetical protein
MYHQGTRHNIIEARCLVMEENNIKGLRSIKTRLIFMVVAMLMVSIIVLTVISAVNTVKQGVGNANEVNEAQAAIVEESVNAIIEKNLEALNVFAYSPSTIAYLDDSEKELKLFENQAKLLRQPVCRNGKTEATVGMQQKIWENWK